MNDDDKAIESMVNESLSNDGTRREEIMETISRHHGPIFATAAHAAFEVHEEVLRILQLMKSFGETNPIVERLILSHFSQLMSKAQAGLLMTAADGTIPQDDEKETARHKAADAVKMMLRPLFKHGMESARVMKKEVLKQAAAPAAPPALRLIRKAEVERLTGLTSRSITNKVAAGMFPRPILLDARQVAWVESRVLEWIAARVLDSDTGFVFPGRAEILAGRRRAGGKTARARQTAGGPAK